MTARDYRSSGRVSSSAAGRPPSGLSPESFRHALGHFLTGVTVVTTVGARGEPIGLTANAFTSVSLDPPLVLVCIARSAASFAAMEQADRYAVHILHQDQHELSRLFARSVAEGAKKFAGVGWHKSDGELPVLDDCLARLECTLRRRVELGDHVGYVGEVYAAASDRIAPPLAFFRGKYTSLAAG
jgi:flavin-dependent trigonelline monooxygenase, reductase component